VLKVLHGPVNVGNQPWVLSRNERALGVKSDLVVNYNTWLGYSADRILTPLSRGSRADRLRRLAFGVTAPLRYDVLHYYFGLSYLCWNDYGLRNRLWFKDALIARRLGRKVFMTLQGCDARLSDRSAARNRYTPCAEGHCQAKPTCTATLDRERCRLIEGVLPAFDRVFVLNPELAHYVPGAVFMPYASVDIESFVPALPRGSERVKILHAPSDPAIKGSQYIIAAVERLKSRYPIDFVLVKGLPHAEALKLYEQADLVIDQALAGWYGGFAVEAMAMGKPVACYIRDEDLKFVPKTMAEAIPLVRITPDTVEADLEAALRRRHEWPEWGRRARDYVIRWHHPRRIAEAMVAAYRDPASHFSLDAEGPNA
jgi:glycosyltransferase involved in cell wall biosynthesis